MLDLEAETTVTLTGKVNFLLLGLQCYDWCLSMCICLNHLEVSTQQQLW